MLYVDKLDALTQEAEKAVKNLFDKAKKKSISSQRPAPGSCKRVL